MQQFLFSYDDICLRPKRSALKSRGEGDTSFTLCGYKFRLPVVPANMLDVISWDVASKLAINNYFYIMHRFPKNTLEFEERQEIMTTFRSLSVGVKDEDKEFLRSMVHTPDFITVDVAHGHHELMKEMLTFLHKLYSGMSFRDRPKFIAGNVATADGFKFLADCGADVVKVGIGGGSICTTRYKTGFHVPTAYSVWECRREERYQDVPIIADGGLKHFGDVAKALVLGADMVMSGRWFAECLDSPARIEHGKKIYRGSTSYEAKGVRNHIEGQTVEIDHACTFEQRLVEIEQALQSSISYAGGKDLSAFNNVEWNLCH